LVGTKRRGRLIKRAGAAGELSDQPGEPALRLVEQDPASAVGEMTASS
jgi:hypothetical protein